MISKDFLHFIHNFFFRLNQLNHFQRSNSCNNIIRNFTHVLLTSYICKLIHREKLMFENQIENSYFFLYFFNNFNNFYSFNPPPKKVGYQSNYLTQLLTITCTKFEQQWIIVEQSICSYTVSTFIFYFFFGARRFFGHAQLKVTSTARTFLYFVTVKFILYSQILFIHFTAPSCRICLFYA